MWNDAKILCNVISEWHWKSIKVFPSAVAVLDKRVSGIWMLTSSIEIWLLVLVLLDRKHPLVLLVLSPPTWKEPVNHSPKLLSLFNLDPELLYSTSSSLYSIQFIIKFSHIVFRLFSCSCTFQTIAQQITGWNKLIKITLYRLYEANSDFLSRLFLLKHLHI